jgi:hypothetical protein
VAEPEGKRLLKRLTRKWENNIKTNLRDTEWGGVAWRGVNWIDLDKDKDQLRTLLNTAINLRVH